MSFPRIFIFYRAAYALFICLNLVFAKLVFPSEVILDPLTLRELLGALIGAAIMIPYMLKSRRVKLTFIT